MARSSSPSARQPPGAGVVRCRPPLPPDAPARPLRREHVRPLCAPVARPGRRAPAGAGVRARRGGAHAGHEGARRPAAPPHGAPHARPLPRRPGGHRQDAPHGRHVPRPCARAACGARGGAPRTSSAPPTPPTPLPPACAPTRACSASTRWRWTTPPTRSASCGCSPPSPSAAACSWRPATCSPTSSSGGFSGATASAPSSTPSRRPTRSWSWTAKTSAPASRTCAPERRGSGRSMPPRPACARPSSATTARPSGWPSTRSCALPWTCPTRRSCSASPPSTRCIRGGVARPPGRCDPPASPARRALRAPGRPRSTSPPRCRPSSGSAPTTSTAPSRGHRRKFARTVSRLNALVDVQHVDG